MVQVPFACGRIENWIVASFAVIRQQWTRVSGTADRRAWPLFLTEKGRKLLDCLRPFAHETYEIALECIDDAERAAVLATLGRMRTTLSRRQALAAGVNG